MTAPHSPRRDPYVRRTEQHARDRRFGTAIADLRRARSLAHRDRPDEAAERLVRAREQIDRLLVEVGTSGAHYDTPEVA